MFTILIFREILKIIFIELVELQEREKMERLLIFWLREIMNIFRML